MIRDSGITDRTMVLTICCSRNRPARFKEMKDSFFATRSGYTELIVYISEDDPSLEEYKKIFEEDKRINYEIGPYKYLVEVNNYFSLKYIEKYSTKYLGEVNDDHIYHTVNFDEILLTTIEDCGGGWGIAHGNSLCNNFPSAVLVSSNIIKTLGYFIYPEFKHLGCDLFINDLGKITRRLFYVPEVTIEHMHAHVGKSQNDSNYDWVYSEDQKTIAQAAYKKWCNEQRVNDVNKVMNAIKLEKETGIKV